MTTSPRGGQSFLAVSAVSLVISAVRTVYSHLVYNEVSHPKPIRYRNDLSVSRVQTKDLLYAASIVK